jgi:hypothetical protein
MIRHRKTLLALGATLLLAAVALPGQAPAPKGPLASPKNRPWPAPVQKVSDNHPGLSPVDAIRTFYMPPGHHIELVANDLVIPEHTDSDGGN